MTVENEVRKAPKQWLTASNICVGVVIVSCLSALVMSIYPGLLHDCVFLVVVLGVFLIPFLMLGLIALFYVLYKKQNLSIKHIPWKHCFITALIIVVTGAVIRLNIPRRIVFANYRNSFQRLVDGDIQSDFNIGPYHIDQCSTDPRGGIYFRTHEGADGIGPDTMSYGFCHNPNPTGTPFGRASYRTAPLGNGWFCFSASDDWL